MAQTEFCGGEPGADQVTKHAYFPCSIRRLALDALLKFRDWISRIYLYTMLHRIPEIAQVINIKLICLNVTKTCNSKLEIS